MVDTPPDLFEQYKQKRDKDKQEQQSTYTQQIAGKLSDPNTGFTQAATQQATTPAQLMQVQPLAAQGFPGVRSASGGGGGGSSHSFGPAVATGAKSWGSFATDLLKSLGAPVTNENLGAILTWFVSEQPPNRPNATWNPLNIQNSDFANMGLSKSGHGQWNFSSEAQGIQAIQRELGTRLYGNIMSALMQGHNPQAVLSAIQSSPWAAGHYGGQLVNRYNPNAYQSLAGGMVAG